MADKDNTALFRNYAYIATFDFFSPPQTTALVLDIFRTLSRNRKKNTRLNIISFICAKKKKSFTKKYWNQLCTIFTVQKCNWKGLINCVFYICIILKTPDVFCGEKVTVNQNTILKWGTLIVIILAWNTPQSLFTVMKFLLFSS